MPERSHLYKHDIEVWIHNFQQGTGGDRGGGEGPDTCICKELKHYAFAHRSALSLLFLDFGILERYSKLIDL